jgi:thioredoxin-related protein
MRLKSFNYFYCLLIIFLHFTSLKSEEKIDIWNKKDKNQSIENKKKRDNRQSG